VCGSERAGVGDDEHLAVSRKTTTALADRLPAHATSPSSARPPTPLRARDICEGLDHELQPKNVEGTRAKMKRLVKSDVLTETDAGNLTRQQ
jgi:hypothetical protein